MTGEKQQLLCPLLSLCMRQRKGGQRGKGRGREESELWEKVQGNAPKTNAMTHLTTRMKHGGGGGRGLWWGREEISTFSLNFKSKFLSRAKRWKKTLLCVGRFAGVKYKRWTAKPHQFKRERNMQSCPTTEAPSSGSISVRKQSTELAWNDELPWSTTERCWLFPGRDTCSCWQSIEVHSTFPLLQSAVFQRLWKNGWKWQDRNIHRDGRQSTRGDNICRSLSEGDVELKWQPWWSHLRKITSIPTCTAHFSFLERSLCFFCPEQSQQKALRLMTVKVISEPRRRLTFLHFPTIMKRDKTAN